MAFGKLEEGIELLEELKIEAEKSNIYTWYVSAESMILRCLTELARIREALDRSVTLRTYLTKFSKRYDLDWISDVGELYIRYRMNDLNKVKEIANRARKTYYVNQLVEATEASRGRDFSKEEVLKLGEDSSRKKLWKYLFLSEFPVTKDFSPIECMKVALEIGERTGSRDIFIRQGNHHHNLIFQIAREEPSMFLEELSRDCLKRVKLRNQSQLEGNETLTSREIQVLKQLATGKAINQIGKELHISNKSDWKRVTYFAKYYEDPPAKYLSKVAS